MVQTSVSASVARKIKKEKQMPNQFDSTSHHLSKGGQSHLKHDAPSKRHMVYTLQQILKGRMWLSSARTTPLPVHKNGDFYLLHPRRLG